MNGSGASRKTVWRAVIGLNLLIAIASGVFGLAALFAPALLLPPAHPALTPEAVYYAALYSAREVPLALGTIVVLLRSRPGSVGTLIAFLVVSGVVQLADVIIGGIYGTAAVAGGTIAAVIHLGSVFPLLKGSPGAPASQPAA
jgi:hypothetical protein